MCHNLYPYGARYLSKKSADAEPEAKAALLYKAYGYAGYSSPYTYGYSAYLTPMVATPMLMVPDMVHTPTWDKMFTIPSMQSIHPELKLSVMARGLLMLPPSTMVAALTLMVPSTWARGLLMLSQRLMLLLCVDLMVMLSPTHMDTLATSDTLPTGAK